ncbi:chitin deacetylase 7-like [Macrobrachium nipponense]|uniref:chitin deacetylase 7-like n=1 Tax=Macrobrachium nipponense TaxID=159736 RepID=UPI0030C8BAB9
MKSNLRSLPFLLLLGAALLLGSALAQEECIQEGNCKRPDCVCASTSNPIAPLPLEFAPQFVVVTVNDAITVTNFRFYKELVSTFRNPNGCRMSMTAFLTHLNTDYTLANELWRLGSEIGVRSVTSSPVPYWKQANYSEWYSEFSEAKKMIHNFARIPEEEIVGTRALHMEVGGDEMYRALRDAGYKYDSSWTALDYTNWYENAKGALYPYTLDFQSPQVPHDCPVGRCPQNTYNGLFVTPVLNLKSISGDPCNMVDACQSSYNETDCPEQKCEDRVFQFLKENFEYNYHGNRAPFGLHTLPAWFESDKNVKSTAHWKGYKRFLQYVQDLDDVWIVSQNKVVEYMKNPVPVGDIAQLEAFQCPTIDPDTNCPAPMGCEYDSYPGSGKITIRICSRPCPTTYPWLGNPTGI